MRKTRLFLAALLAFASVFLAGLAYRRHSGSFLSENGTVDSEILDETMHYSIYLPHGYHMHKNNRKDYPVLYLLHGATGNHTVYPRRIGIKALADKAIRDGDCGEMVIVMPRSCGGVYVNLRTGVYSYEDYFFRELIPHIEKTFRVRPGNGARAIAGHSMGGHGALFYALKYPDRFVSCCAVGASFEFKEDDETDYGPSSNDLGRLLRRAAQNDRASKVRFMIDCGKDDSLCEVNGRFHRKMTDLGIDDEFHVGEGGHTWEYWRKAMPNVLRFTGKSFRQNPKKP